MSSSHASAHPDSPAVGDGAPDGYDATDGADETYRSLSVIALLSLLLGLASPLALVAPLLLVLPLLALLLSILGLRQIGANPDIYTGRLLALLGLMLAATCLSAVAAKSFVSKRLLSVQTEPLARLWVNLVLDDYKGESYLLTLRPSSRPAERLQLGLVPEDSLDESPDDNDDENTQKKSQKTQQKPDDSSNEAAVGRLQSYGVQPVVLKLQALGDNPQTTLTNHGEVEWLGRGRVRFTQYYEVRDAAGKRVDLVLQFERSSTKAGGGWRVISAKTEN